MGIPVKFYFVTAEEYEKLREKMLETKEGSDQKTKEAQELEGGIFFV